MSNYKKQAVVVYGNGYPIVPINRGSKAPYIKGWQDTDFTPDAITAGVGIKCGIGPVPLCAVDIDVTDADLAGRISSLYQDMAGYTLERVGQAPKTMLLYRAAAAGWTKAASAWFSEEPWVLNDKNVWETAGTPQRVEILGKGQQFVALHEHPDTHKPYEWVDMLGGIEGTPADELAVISEAMVMRFLEVADQMVEDAGMFMKPDSLPNTTKSLSHIADSDNFLAGAKVGLSIDDARTYLEHLGSDDHDLWIKIGMALKSEFGDNPDAFVLYDDWSSRSASYNGSEEIQDKWDRFSSEPGAVTAKTIIKLGNAATLRHNRELRHAVLADYLSDITNSVDIYSLTDEVLPRLGDKVDTTDVVTIKAIKDAALAKSKELGYPLNLKEIDAKLGIRKEVSSEMITKASQFSEDGNAQRMIADCLHTIMYVPENKNWYEWETYYWRVVDQVYIQRKARDSVNNMISEGAALGMLSGDDLLDFIRSSHRLQTYRNMVGIAQADENVLVRVTELDANKNLFGVGNGAIDLLTGKLVPSNPLDRITIASQVNFVAGADCPVFKQTLSDVFFGDADMIEFFQRLMGYTMLGNPTEHFFVIPYGAGANGKSTIFGAISDVFGDHAKTADSSTLLGGGGGGGNAGGPREDILRLMGSRFVYVSEPDDGGVLKEGLVKGMSGGDTMAARGMHAKATIEVKPTWTVFMPTNHKPIIKGVDLGIWRRILPIPFERNFENDPDVVKDLRRNEKLAEEQSGILNWLIEGALSYQKNKMQVPQKVVEARAAYRDDMDLLADWLDECCEIGPSEFAANDALFSSWRAYGEANGEMKAINNSRSLGRRLAAKGFETFKNAHGIRGRGFDGISVKIPDAAQGFDDLSLIE